MIESKKKSLGNIASFVESMFKDSMFEYIFRDTLPATLPKQIGKKPMIVISTPTRGRDNNLTAEIRVIVDVYSKFTDKGTKNIEECNTIEDNVTAIIDDYDMKQYKLGSDDTYMVMKTQYGEPITYVDTTNRYYIVRSSFLLKIA